MLSYLCYLMLPSSDTSSYYAVAVVRKGSGVTWETLIGRKSCHTGLGRTAGWNIPMGLLHKDNKECDFCEFARLGAPQHPESSRVHFRLFFSFIAKYFSKSCAPGADPDSSLCKLCKGSEGIRGIVDKCKASTAERYYGYAGAFRYDSHQST